VPATNRGYRKSRSSNDHFLVLAYLRCRGKMAVKLLFLFSCKLFAVTKQVALLSQRGCAMLRVCL